MYNDNKYFSHTWKCISCYTRQCIITNMYFSLYKKTYNDNKYLLYMKVYFSLKTMYDLAKHKRVYIITINISLIHESVYRVYKMIYNDNIYLSLYKIAYIMKQIFLLYMKMYNENKHLCYTWKRISCIQDNKYFMIYENVFLIIQEDV